MYDPDEREAMTEVLAERLYSAEIVRTGIGEGERWTSPGGGVVVEFGVHGDTTARVYGDTIHGQPSRLIGITPSAAGLLDLLPPAAVPGELGELLP